MINQKRQRRSTVAGRSRRMTASDAERAILIDFEGRKGYRPHPDLIGVYDPFEPPESRFYQVILRDVLTEAAKAGPGHAVASLASVIAHLVDRAEAERALIVGYSQYELGMVKKYVGRDDPELYRRFERVYRDARARARSWANRNGYVALMPAGDDFNLGRFLDFIDFPYRRNFRRVEVSQTLRTMHAHFKAGRHYRSFRKGHKRVWHDVLGHNRCDVEGTRQLLLVATGARVWQPTVARGARVQPTEGAGEPVSGAAVAR